MVYNASDGRKKVEVINFLVDVIHFLVDNTAFDFLGAKTVVENSSTTASVETTL